MDWPGLLDVVEKLGLAIVLSGMLGLERERRGRAAGLRTHILVCLGATVAMILSEHLAEGSIEGRLDRARLAAGVITGIGFLGAGTIINDGNIHRGLTTAAMVWFVAALGLAIGAEQFMLAIVSTFAALFVTIGFGFIHKALRANDVVFMRVQTKGSAADVKQFEQAFHDLGLKVETSRIQCSRENDFVEITFEITSQKRPNLDALAVAFTERFPHAGQLIFERWGG